MATTPSYYDNHTSLPWHPFHVKRKLYKVAMENKFFLPGHLENPMGFLVNYNEKNNSNMSHEHRQLKNFDTQ
jgi:hypothetical protein